MPSFHKACMNFTDSTVSLELITTLPLASMTMLDGLLKRAKAPMPQAQRPRKITRAPSHPMSHGPVVRGNLALAPKAMPIASLAACRPMSRMVF